MISGLKHIYLLGAGGIGMSALGRYFLAQNIAVSGYDKTPNTFTKSLENDGFEITYNEQVDALPSFLKHGPSEEVLVIYTPAIPQDHPQKLYLIEQGFRLYKRSEILGIISDEHPTIAVAGTHGKTTTSTLIAHMLQASGRKPVSFLGGVAVNYNTNFLAGQPNSILVAEADEYDRSFLTLHPQTGIITSVDADHLDIYGGKEYLLDSFAAFAGQVSENLILKQGLELPADLYARATTYSTKLQADVMLENCRMIGDYYTFDVNFKGKIFKDLRLGLPGFHNVENALAVIAAVTANGLSEGEIRASLDSFQGVKRRFEYVIRQDDLIYIDDYAHHPEELKACIGSIRKIYPNRKITGVFQPHLFSRTRDFMDGFASSLSMLDEVYLLDIYPAREKPIEGITSAVLLEQISCTQKHLVKKEDLPEIFLSQRPDVLVTLGAGDIDQVVGPIKDCLTSKSVKL
jgi:UDP-N-acetylmuramate--alanine ligase